MTSQISHIEVEGEVIQDLILRKIAPAVQGERKAHAILALLSMSVMLMKPDVEVETLKDTVMHMSETMILNLAETEGEA